VCNKENKQLPPVEVSVIIPTYNRGYVVCEALDSVLAQTYKDFEVIIVDDGSIDDTRDKMRLYLKDGRVRYVYQENSGVSCARNKGVALARGQYVSFLDSDDLWKPDKLRLEINFFSKYPEVRVVFSDMEECIGEKFKPSFIKERSSFMGLLPESFSRDGIVMEQRELFLCLLEEFVMSLCAFSVSKHVFERVGGFDESYRSGEDWEFFLRLTRVEQCGYIDRPLAVVRRSQDSLHRSTLESSLKGTVSLLSKYRKELKNDQAALARLRISTKNMAIKLYRHYLGNGQRFHAFKTCLYGYKETRDTEMLLRAIAICMPAKTLNRVK